MRTSVRAAVVLMPLVLTSCFGASQIPRTYYVIAGEPLDFRHHAAPIQGLLYVRSLDADAVYEKFQIVVRNSPYQLRYSDQNVWAVKPHQMISDLIAQALDHTNTFESVTRELIEARPKFTLSGQLNAAEIYDSDDVWFAHVSLDLHLSRFADGNRVWTYEFERRKQLSTTSFAHGARALSELTQMVIRDVVDQLGKLAGVAAPSGPTSPFDEVLPGGPANPSPPRGPPSEPIYVPETDDRPTP